MKRYGGLIVLLIGLFLFLNNVLGDGLLVYELLFEYGYIDAEDFIETVSRVSRNWLIAAGLVFTGITLMALAAKDPHGPVAAEQRPRSQPPV